MEKYGEAKSYAEKAVELSKKENSLHIEGRARIWLGRVIGKMDPSKSNEAETEILNGINICEELSLRPVLSLCYFFLGELFANTDRKEDALENLNKSLTMCLEMGIEYWPPKIQEVLNRLQ